jgi:hypothetical protein
MIIMLLRLLPSCLWECCCCSDCCYCTILLYSCAAAAAAVTAATPLSYYTHTALSPLSTHSHTHPFIYAPSQARCMTPAKATLSGCDNHANRGYRYIR